MPVSRKNKRRCPISARAVLEKADIPALLVTNLVNLRYLSGLTLSAGYGLVSPGGITLFLDDRYLETGRHAAYAGLSVQPIKLFERYVSRLKGCAAESDSLTVAALQKLQEKLPDVRFLPSVGAIEYWRRSKSADELRRVRKACRMTKKMLRQVPGMLRAGVTEKEIAWNLTLLAHEYGADSMAFDTIVGFGTNTALPHHRPTDRVLAAGDLVQIDVGVVYQDYCSDYSRVFFTAAPTVDQKKAYTSLLKAKREVTARIRPGVTVGSLDAHARKILARDGYEKEFCHALGHGVGLEIHEGVVLSTRMAETPLLPGEVITIEPGLYFPGKWGMRVEDTEVVPFSR